MTTTRFYLDRRHKESGKPQPLKLCITKKGVAAYIPLGISVLPSQWNSVTQKVTDHPNKRTINAYLENRKTEIDNLIMSLTASGKLAGLTAVQIKNIVSERIDPDSERADLFASRFERFALSRTAARTRDLYAGTLKKLREFDSSLQTLTFDMITKEWLGRFAQHLIAEGLGKNSRNIHFRNIRAVFNDAIDNGITQNYPLRKFDMAPEETVKRSLTVEHLRELFSYPVDPWQQRYVDYFKLTFLRKGLCDCNFCKVILSAFDLGKDTAPFQEYLKRFGTKARGEQIYSYMAMVALQNHDYEAAVEAYDNMDELEPSMQSNYMKAYFLRAKQLMDKGSWRAAVPLLKTAAYYSPARDGFNQLSRFQISVIRRSFYCVLSGIDEPYTR